MHVHVGAHGGHRFVVWRIGVADLSDDELLYPEALAPFDGFVRGEVARKSFLEKEKRAVQNEYRNMFERAPGARGEIVRVARKGQRFSEPVSIRRHVAMDDGEGEDVLVADLYAVKRFDGDELEVVQMRIVHAQAARSRRVGQDREFGREAHGPSPMVKERQTGGRIRMDMREQDGVDFLRTGFLQLFEDVRSGVDEKDGLFGNEKGRRTPPPAFATLSGVHAGRIGMTGSRDGARRSRAEKLEEHAFIVAEDRP